MQSNVFKDSTRVFIVSLVNAGSLSQPDNLLNPEFQVDGTTVYLFPLDIASASNADLVNRLVV